jgi:virginiamycin B lyase
MRRPLSAVAALAAATALTLTAPLAADARPPVAPPTHPWVAWHEYPVPATSPSAVLAASDGLVWFADGSSSLITVFDPTTGLTTAAAAPARDLPTELIEGADGLIWWADFSAASLGRLDPVTGSVTDLPLPAGMHPLNGSVAPDGSLWWGTDAPGTVVRVAPDGSMSARIVPWAAEPSDVAWGADGRLWMIAAGGSSVGAYDTVGGSFDEYPIGAAWTTSLELGADGALWVTDGDSLLRVDTTGAPMRFPVPGGEYVADVASGGRGVVLLDSANRMFAVDSRGFTPLGTGAPGATPGSISVSPSGTTWYADPLRETLGVG